MTNLKNTNTNLRCATYIRVSDAASEEQKTAIDNQLSYLHQYCLEHDWEITETYIDISPGTTPKRDNLQRMIADMSKNKFDIILSKDLSRLSINGALSYAIRDAALQNNIKLITLDGALNMLENDLDMFGIYTWLYEQDVHHSKC